MSKTYFFRGSEYLNPKSFLVDVAFVELGNPVKDRELFRDHWRGDYLNLQSLTEQVTSYIEESVKADVFDALKELISHHYLEINYDDF